VTKGRLDVLCGKDEADKAVLEKWYKSKTCPRRGEIYAFQEDTEKNRKSWIETSRAKKAKTCDSEEHQARKTAFIGAHVASLGPGPISWKIHFSLNTCTPMGKDYNISHSHNGTYHNILGLIWVHLV